MTRYLIVSNDIIVNIVESPTIPSNGGTAYPAVTGNESVGDSLLTVLWYVQQQKQAALDALLDNNFDLKAFIRGGTSTLISGVNVGVFLATIANNYRTLRASIANAGSVATVNAININSGWPANP
jgi:hypothetical protein